MSVRVMALVWDSSVPAPERFTLLALADRADEDGKCWPSIPTLGRKCCTSESTIRRHLTALEKQGVLLVQRRFNTSSLYTINLGHLRDLSSCTPPQSDRGCQSDTPPQSDRGSQSGRGSQSDRTPPVNLGGPPSQIDRLYTSDPSVDPSEVALASLATPLSVDRFAEFYATYPRKKDRRKAEQAWRAALKRKANPDRIIAAAKSYASAGTDLQFVKYPATWLNAEAYLDEPESTSHLALVPTPALHSFEDYRSAAAAEAAARLLGIGCVLRPQPPSDKTPRPQWLRTTAVEWIDEHEAELRAALTERKTG